MKLIKRGFMEVLEKLPKVGDTMIVNGHKKKVVKVLDGFYPDGVKAPMFFDFEAPVLPGRVHALDISHDGQSFLAKYDPLEK